MPSKLLPISSKEQKWVEHLSPSRGEIYHFTRGYIRYAMSCLSGLDPLKIPLKADPGQPPLLAEGWGHVSISHCSDALLIGWSQKKIGVDIERKDRNLKARQLSKRFYNLDENHEIKNLTESEVQERVLTRWVIKEAAIKWQGGKISNDLNKWIWKNSSPFAYHQELGHKVKIYNQTYKDWNYALALDLNSEIAQPIICIN